MLLAPVGDKTLRSRLCRNVKSMAIQSCGLQMEGCEFLSGV